MNRKGKLEEGEVGEAKGEVAREARGNERRGTMRGAGK